MESLVQIQEEPSLLERMMQGLEVASDVYQPTKYWNNYKAKLIEEIQQKGLHNLRRRSGSPMDGFGSLECWPAKSRGRKLFMELLSRRVILDHLSPRPGPSLANITKEVMLAGLSGKYILMHPDGQISTEGQESCIESLLQLATNAGRTSRWARPFSELEDALIGAPEAVMQTPDGKNILLSTIWFYIRYAFVADQINFDNIQHVAELGPGLGRQAELLLQLHPDLAVSLFDIPPPLYVAYSYLRTRFPEAVRQYNNHSKIEPQAGTIQMHGNWMMQHLNTVPVDLFWNAASFQEMEPDTVAHYLRDADHADSIYMIQRFHGQHLAGTGSESGVEEPVTANHYIQCLPNHRLSSCSPAWRPIFHEPDYHQMVWTRS